MILLILVHTDAADLMPEIAHSTVPENTRLFVQRFRRNANTLVLRYGAPVWLVGGALRDDPPRDWDIRILLTDEDAWRLFRRKHDQPRTEVDLYDFADWEWRRGYENLKQSRILSERYVTNIDFQLQLVAETRLYEKEPRLRLDSASDDIFRAGLPVAS